MVVGKDIPGPIMGVLGTRRCEIPPVRPQYKAYINS